MADLIIPIHEYIGESSWSWDYDVYERATNCDDLRQAVEYAGYRNETFDRIVLEIGTCYGGSVDEGLAMFHYLQEQGVPVHTRILGTVASMGTVLPLAGDTVECATTSQWMVHAPSNEFWGTSAEIKAGLKGLDGCTAALAAVYQARTGADAATVAQWMSQDTWFTAAEALAAGLCTAVVPLRPKTAPAAPALNAAQASARRTRFAEAVARADKRAAPAAPAPAPKPVTPPAAAAAAPTPAPMATAPKPTPRAAAPAAKKTAKPASARKTLFQQLKDLFNDVDEEEADATADGSEAAVESTELDNGAFLYHDGALAVDTAVFNDEAMTEATADGDYDTKDAQMVTVAAGIVTALTANTSGNAAADTTATASLAKRFEALEAKVGKLETAKATLETENARLRQQKPPLPTARAARANADAPDPKAGASVKQPVEGAGTL